MQEFQQLFQIEIATPLKLAGVIVLVLSGVCLAIIRGPFKNVKIRHENAFVLLNRFVVLIFVLALIAVASIFILQPLLQKESASEESPIVGAQTFESLLAYELFDSSIRSARTVIAQNLNNTMSNLEMIGFPHADSGNKLLFFAQMARAFHDDPESPNANARPYAQRAVELPAKSDMDKEWKGIAATILASTYLFDANLALEKYDKAFENIILGETLLNVVNAPRSKLWHKYNTLLGDYKSEALYRRINRAPAEAAQLCVDGLKRANEQSDRFALERFLFRGFKNLLIEVPAHLAADREVPMVWKTLLRDGLRSFETYARLAQEEGKPVSGRTALTYLGALELATRGRFQFGVGIRDQKIAFQKLDLAVRKYEPAVQSWSNQQRFQTNHALFLVERGGWHARLLVLADAVPGHSQNQETSWRIVRDAINQMKTNPLLAASLKDRLLPTFRDLAKLGEPFSSEVENLESYLAGIPLPGN